MPHYVVATTKPAEFTRARQLLQRFGTVERTNFYNVLLVIVDDIDRFMIAYLERMAEDPRLQACVSSLLPMRKSFTFSELADFEEQAKATAIGFADQLEGMAFHVRIHRRGHRQEMSSLVEEKFLDGHLLEELERRGRPGRISFDDPDAILDVETVGDLAGMALWTREDLLRLPFLKTD